MACKRQPYQTIVARINNFEPEVAQEMWSLLRDKMSINKILAVEVDHCPQSYACLLHSTTHGNIIYSGDSLPCTNMINYA